MASLRYQPRPGPLSPIGFGAFKIGRNQKIKYPQEYGLPGPREVERLLHGVLDLGINYIDTAPAYGTSEARIGQALSGRRREFVLSTKVGEVFEDGQSRYDFSARAVRESVHRSLERLRCDVLDLVFIHSNGDDLAILEGTDAVSELLALRAEGKILGLGLSSKSLEGARAALPWAAALMLEYHLENRAAEAVIAEAAEAGVEVMIKKGLGSGRLRPEEAIPFVLRQPGVTSMLVGSLHLEHLSQDLAIARAVRPGGQEKLKGKGCGFAAGEWETRP